MTSFAPVVTPPLLPETSAIVVAHNVGKCYQLFAKPQDRLKHAFGWRFGKTYGRPFWALHDVSFEVRHGEMLGVIGRNGSGKSTLLQMIAGILAPTQGTIEVNGRVGALLELGSGFNPEFTGRENVFLNGAILGISAAEMTQRFEEIVAFAEIGDFIDQPVKTYSSGMFVRLAFAVTTSLECDVLLIDEALAVGDIFFRQKCYQRLQSLLKRGVAIVFVSHSMMDVEQYCQRAILLHHGKSVFQGAASEAVKRYYLIEQEERLSSIQQRPIRSSSAQPEGNFKGEDLLRPPPEAFLDIAGVSQVSNGWARCVGVAVCDLQNQPRHTFQQGETARFFYKFELLQDIEAPIGGVVLQNEQGIIVHGKNTLQLDTPVPPMLPQGSSLSFCQDIVLDVAPGEYTFEVGLATMSQIDYECRMYYSHTDLRTKIMRLCHLPTVGRFVVGVGQTGLAAQLLHHGLANLPGKCQVAFYHPEPLTSELR